MSEITHAPLGTPQTSPRRGYRLGLFLAFLPVLALLAIFGWNMFDDARGQVNSGLAPDFTLSLFDGGELTLSELRGQIIVVNFWASWCIPCRDEAPILEQAWRRYRDRGVVFIGVAYLDTDKESRAFLEEFDVTYPNGPDLGTRIAPDYRIKGVPETFFIARDGRVADLEIGPLTEARLVGAIESLLAE